LLNSLESREIKGRARSCRGEGKGADEWRRGRSTWERYMPDIDLSHIESGRGERGKKP